MSRPWLTGGGLLLLALFFAREPLLGPRTFFMRDLQSQWHPQVESFVHAVAEGAWPVWDPHPAFGQPMLGNPNTQVLYPFTWLNLVLRPWSFYTFYFAAHLTLAGLGAALAARRLGASRLAAASAGALWLASGPLLSLGNLWNHLAGAAWLPWAMAAALTPGARAVVGWGACVGLMVLGGSPDLALLGAALSGIVGLLLGPAGRTPAHRVGRAAGAAAFALAISAGQWWPALEWARQVGRLDLPRALRVYWAAEPAALWQSVLPVPWQLLRQLGSAAPSFEGREPYLLSLYVGLPAIGLALLGAWRGPRPAGPVLLVAAALALLTALGDRTPLYGLLADTLPLLRPMRFPAKTLVPAALLLALLAALGLDAWRAALARGRLREALLPALPLALLLVLIRTPLASTTARPAALGALIVGAAVAARGPARARAATRTLALAATLDLAFCHAGLNVTAPRETLARDPPVAAALRGRRALVYDYDASANLARSLLGREAAVPRLLALDLSAPDAGQRALLALRGFPASPAAATWSARGSFGRDLLGLQPREYNRLSGLVLLTADAGLRLTCLRLAGVERVVALHQQGLEGLVELARFPGPAPEPVRVYDVPGTLPRAYAVGRARLAADDEAERLLLAGSLEPGEEILLASAPGGTRGRSFAGPATVTWVEERADRLRLEVDLPSDGWLVVSDLWAPGWNAWVDGRPTAVRRANLLFRAVQVPEGRHAVALAYRPRGLLVSLCVSSAALLLGLGCLARRGRTAPGDREPFPAHPEPARGARDPDAPSGPS